ncbi:MAG: fibrobacter succinogenes major paralogous domain-containing protein [Dysgonamonadaceae bacterium]|jgi:uncharacterized protein (TIGR02145 family)|nr:fibrobacter succinogenes major paralogous domain-containing protein [Dysgonamonadaceae bacterium]
MKKRFFYFVPALVLMSAASVNGQVLIGGGNTDEPHAAAVLDLASGGQTDKGLLLPNVALTGNATDFVLKPDAGSPEKQTATGMIVYNTATTLKGRGIYVWDGNSWMSLNSGPCPKTITDIENNEYFVGDFGDAGCWMTQNLLSTYNDMIGEGELEKEAFTDGDTSLQYYYYPPGGSVNLNPEYGLLYTWAAATDGRVAAAGQHVQGICPRGWHVPSKAEWEDLEEEIASDANGRYSTCLEDEKAGKKMKSVTPGYEATHSEPNGASHHREANGFDALLINNIRNEVGFKAYFWTSTNDNDNDNKAESICLNDFDPADDEVIYLKIDKVNMFTVRCKRDY